MVGGWLARANGARSAIAIAPGCLLTAAVGFLAVTHPAVGVGLALGAMLVVLFWVRPYWGYVLLVCGAMLTRFRFATSVGHWRLEQLLAVLSIVAVLRIMREASRWRSEVRVLDPVGLVLILWVAANAFASLFAPDVFASEKIAVWLATDILAYIFVRCVAQYYGYLYAFVPFFILGFCEVVAGIIIYAFQFHVPGIRAYGTMQEPDVFGTFASVMVVLGMSVRALRGRTYRGVRRLGSLVIVGAVLAMVSSATRSSLVGLTASVLAGITLIPEVRRILAGWTVVGAIGFVVSIGYVLHRQVSQRLHRFSTASTLTGRLRTVRAAVRGSLRSVAHFVMGHGTNAFQQTHAVVIGGVLKPNYLSVQIVAVLYDTGVIGLFLFVVLAVMVVRSVVTRRFTEPALKPLAIGSMLACVAMFVAYQATNGDWFGYTWIVVALAVVAGEVRPSGGVVA